MTKNTDINKADFDYSAFKKKAIKDLYLGKELTGKNGVFGGMVKDILEAALSEELNQHLLQEKESFGNDVDAEFALNNRRNGYNSHPCKTHFPSKPLPINSVEFLVFSKSSLNFA